MRFKGARPAALGRRETRARPPDRISRGMESLLSSLSSASFFLSLAHYPIVSLCDGGKNRIRFNFLLQSITDGFNETGRGQLDLAVDAPRALAGSLIFRPGSGRRTAPASTRARISPIFEPPGPHLTAGPALFPPVVSLSPARPRETSGRPIDKAGKRLPPRAPYVRRFRATRTVARRSGGPTRCAEARQRPAGGPRSGDAEERVDWPRRGLILAASASHLREIMRRAL